MAAAPIVIYSHKVDSLGVLRLLRQLAPDLHLVGPENNWQSITIRGPKRLVRRPWTLSLWHDSDYYTSAKWEKQIVGMEGYFSRFPENHNTSRIMLLIRSFRFALTTFPAPDPELYLNSDDPRLSILFAVTKYLDGAIFTPSTLRDASGRVLYGDQEPDPAAMMPAIVTQVPAPARSQRPRSLHGIVPDPGDPSPPTPQRVARRALALAAVAGRALLEREDFSDAGVADTRTRIMEWIEQTGISKELEPDEWKVLQSPLGSVLPQDAANASWRLEGLGVLAWALQCFELPPHDQLVSAGKLLPSMNILNPTKARELLENPTLRPSTELAARREQLFALHWRLTEWRLKQTALDFEQVAQTAWFGPLELSGVRLLDRDLAIGNQPISRAPAEAIGAAVSSAMERHLAINWLNGGSIVYSETDVST